MRFRTWTRRIGLGLVAVAWLLAAHPQAQTAPTLEWQHDGLNVTEFKCQIDSGTLASLGLPTPSGTTYSAALSTCGTIEKGQHLLYVYACNGTTCTAASAIYVVKL